MSAEIDRDSKGNEHVHATLRDHRGVHKIDKVAMAPDGKSRAMDMLMSDGEETKTRKGKREKDKKNRDPVYRTLGGRGLPPPKSERESFVGDGRCADRLRICISPRSIRD